MWFRMYPSVYRIGYINHFASWLRFHHRAIRQNGQGYCLYIIHFRIFAESCIAFVLATGWFGGGLGCWARIDLLEDCIDQCLFGVELPYRTKTVLCRWLVVVGVLFEPPTVCKYWLQVLFACIPQCNVEGPQKSGTLCWSVIETGKKPQNAYCG